MNYPNANPESGLKKPQTTENHTRTLHLTSVPGRVIEGCKVFFFKWKPDRVKLSYGVAINYVDNGWADYKLKL